MPSDEEIRASRLVLTDDRIADLHRGVAMPEFVIKLSHEDLRRVLAKSTPLGLSGMMKGRLMHAVRFASCARAKAKRPSYAWRLSPLPEIANDPDVHDRVRAPRAQ
jgi:hypothetical protein